MSGLKEIEAKITEAVICYPKTTAYIAVIVTLNFVLEVLRYVG